MIGKPTLLLALAAGALAIPKAAEACGGLFCDRSRPVIQTGEQIIFAMDRPSRTVDAIINVFYQGNANEFAWLLPLQSEPTEIKTGPSWAFFVADALTAPRFVTTTETDGICASTPRFGAEDASNGGFFPRNAGVDVLQHGVVGPYEHVVLKGSDPEKVREWLVKGGYAVTDQMFATVVPYVAKGDVLLALKLTKESDVGDITPIWVTMTGIELCVPLRMTAVAAQPDLGVTALVLSNEGRAIPENYFHVTPNLAAIDWLTAGSNYRQVISRAADEGQGNAFTTEYAGTPRRFAGLIDHGKIDVAALRAARSPDAFQRLLFDMLGRVPNAPALDDPNDPALQLSSSGFGGNRELNSILARHVTGGDGDLAAAANEIEERIVVPSRNVQALFDRYRYLTRLYTLISPEEMNVDPTFTFRADLPDVDNVHRAKMVLHCGTGGVPGSAGVDVHIQETGEVIQFESNRGPTGTRERLDRMPGSTQVEQLVEGRVVKDNRENIASLLDEHNAANGCGCGSAKVRSGASLASLIFLALAFATRRVVKRR